ncbi:MAG: transcription-repair coupling factor (superfamily II helicase) [Kiritimatiellia bacterium]
MTRLREELLDRFGPLPPPVKRLLQIADLRILAHAHQLQTVRVRAGRLHLARNGVYLKHGKRFPRLRGETPDMQLDEIGELIETLESWAAAAA